VQKYGISFIGAGKVAGALSRALSDSGHRIINIVSRKKEYAAANC
jgi:predicted dinucleotide-binding enzyme